MGNFLNLRSKFIEINRIISYYHGDKTNEPLDTFFRTNGELPPRSYVFQPIFERFYDNELYKHQLSGLAYEEYVSFPDYHVNAPQVNNLSDLEDMNKRYYTQLEYPNILNRVRSYRIGAPTPFALPADTVIQAINIDNNNNNNVNNIENDIQPTIQVANTNSSQQSVQQLSVAELLVESPKLLQEITERNVRSFVKQYKNYVAKAGHLHPSFFITIEVINLLLN
jgi:hypothetical protein